MKKLGEFFDEISNLGTFEFVDLDLFRDSRGTMARYSETFMDEKDLAEFNFRQESTGRSLQEFAEAAEPDIYDQRKMAEMSSQDDEELIKQEAEKARKIKELFHRVEEKQNLVPDMQDFFEQTSQSIDTFEKLFGDDHIEKEREEELQRILDEEKDEEFYQKELMAKMQAGKISSREFGVLMNNSFDVEDAEAQAKKMFERKKIEFRHELRNAEELIESQRRRKVLDGEWTEEESQKLMKEKMLKLKEKFPTEKEFDVFFRELWKSKENEQKLLSKDMVIEREYYFDENLGESLNDHIEQIKSQFKSVNVQTRRDRDGFPIVKLQLKQQFKYDMDKFFQLHPDQLRKIQRENQEALLDVFFPKDPETMIKRISGVEKSAALTQPQYQRVQDLITERLLGTYEKSYDDFVSDLQAIKQDSYGPPA